MCINSPFLKLSFDLFYCIYRAASIAASLGDNRRRLVTIWPEWSDADINGEKWVCITAYNFSNSIKTSCCFCVTSIAGRHIGITLAIVVVVVVCVGVGGGGGDVVVVRFSD